MDPSSGLLLGGKFRLERPLARGGMGSVWVARHAALGTQVAVKLINPESAASRSARARFEREARAAAALKTPHVAQVHDYGVEGDLPYIVMELLEGEDLAARLGRAGRLGVTETMDLVVQICRTLSAAHAAGIVHRDIKPENVFLCRQPGERDFVKVLDFGIAKGSGPLAGEVTRSGGVVGSPAYMSPEQIRKSSAVDHRADLWGLGVIAFRCLTGRLPFAGEEMGELLMAVCLDAAPVPSSLVPGLGLDPAVDAFCARALARDPARRFQSAREMSDAAVALGGGALVTAAAPALDGSERARTVRDTEAGEDEEPEELPLPSPTPVFATVAPEPQRRGRSRTILAALAGAIAAAAALTGARYLSPPVTAAGAPALATPALTTPAFTTPALAEPRPSGTAPAEAPPVAGAVMSPPAATLLPSPSSPAPSATATAPAIPRTPSKRAAPAPSGAPREHAIFGF